MSANEMIEKTIKYKVTANENERKYQNKTKLLSKPSIV